MQMLWRGWFVAALRFPDECSLINKGCLIYWERVVIRTDEMECFVWLAEGVVWDFEDLDGVLDFLVG